MERSVKMLVFECFGLMGLMGLVGLVGLVDCKDCKDLTDQNVIVQFGHVHALVSYLERKLSCLHKT